MVNMTDWRDGTKTERDGRSDRRKKEREVRENEGGEGEIAEEGGSWGADLRGRSEEGELGTVEKGGEKRNGEEMRTYWSGVRKDKKGERGWR